MDTRLTLAALGLVDGDAHIIRNAGGIVTDDEIRSLAISQHMLGTEEVMVIQHTGCGLLGFTDEEFAELLEEHAGRRPPWRAGTFSELEESVRGAVDRIRSSPFLVHTDRVRGFIYDVKSGRLTEVQDAEQ
jgi:carbonic anhydrase